MLLFDNGSDERRVIILATSDNLTITEESTSWYLDGTFKWAPQLFYQLLVLHAELTDTPGKSWILLTQKDTPIYLEAFEAPSSNCPALLRQVVMADFEQALRSALSTSFPGATVSHSTRTFLLLLYIVSTYHTYENNVAAYLNLLAQL